MGISKGAISWIGLMPGKAYSKEEDDILREWYAKEGLPGAIWRLHMSGYIRTSNSVKRRASQLKVKSPYCMANITPNLPAKHFTWHPRWEANYAQAYELIKEGLQVSVACRVAGIERSAFYRMRKVKEGK